MTDIKEKIRQETGSYCGPAVIEMLVKNIGRSVAQKEIVVAAEAENYVMKEGIPLIDLAKGVKKLFPDLVVWEKQNSSLEEIKKLVEAGYPVAVDWQGIFTADEYKDDVEDKWSAFWNKLGKGLTLNGDQGHYCIVIDIDLEEGFVKFVDPYGHYAGKTRFVATWEFEERWWDDRLGKGEAGKKTVILENKLMFVIASKSDSFLETVGMTWI